MDAQVLSDAATRGDVEGIRMVLLEHNQKSTENGNLGDRSGVGYAWFCALFSRFPSKAHWQESVSIADEFPSIEFVNEYVIQKTPHISLRVLLLLPSYHYLPWCAIHATIERIQQNRIVERHALSCLSEIRIFLSRAYSDLLQQNIDTNFLKGQLTSLVQAAAYPLLFVPADKSKDLSNSMDNGSILLPLEILPSVLSTAHRIDQVNNVSQVKTSSNGKRSFSFVAEICDILFGDSSSLSIQAHFLSSAHIVPFLKLVLDCASFLQLHHWSMLRERILVQYLHSSKRSLHPLHYAELLRICIAILAWFPNATEDANVLTGQQIYVPRADKSLLESNKTFYGWEYVIVALYYSASRLNCPELGVLDAMDMVLLSEIGQLPKHTTMRILRFVQLFVFDLLLPSSDPEKLKEKNFYNICGFDKDTILWMCCNLTLVCFKSQDAPRHTFRLAVSTLCAQKLRSIDSGEQAVNTLLTIVHVKSLMTDSQPMGDSKECYLQRINFASIQERGITTKNVSKHQLERFASDLSKLSSLFYFSTGGKCCLELCKGDPYDESCSIKSVSIFLPACAEVVYQSIHSGSHNDVALSCSSSLHFPHMELRGDEWIFIAFSILSWVPTRSDDMHRCLLAISIITCIFLEVPSSRADIVSTITERLTQGFSSEKNNAFLFCSLFSVLVRSVVNDRHNRIQMLGQDRLQEALKPIFYVINSNVVVTDDDVRNSLVRTVLLLSSGRRDILSLGKKLLTNHKLRLHHRKAKCSDLTAALDILLELVDFNILRSGRLIDEYLPFEGDSCSSEAILILNDIILFEKFSLQLSDRTMLFHKLAEMALTQRLPPLCSLQLLRVSLRKLLRYFVVNEASSNLNNPQGNAYVEQCCDRLFFLPARCFSKVNEASATEDIPGLLYLSLILVTNCIEGDADFCKVILSALQQSLDNKASTVYPENLKQEKTLRCCDRFSTVYSATISICKALLFSSLSDSSSWSNKTDEEPESRRAECQYYQTTLAAEFERDYKSLNLYLPPRSLLLPASGDGGITEHSLVNSLKSSKQTESMITSLRSNCLDVIIYFLLSQNKYEAAICTEESGSTAELLETLDYFLPLHPRSSDADAYSRIRLASAFSFFGFTKHLNSTLIQYPFATKFYCTELQSVLNDANIAEISFESILEVADNLIHIYAHTRCGRFRSNFYASDQLSGMENETLESYTTRAEVFSCDFISSVILALSNCLSALKKFLSISIISPVSPAFQIFRRVVIGEESGGSMPWFNLIHSLCMDIHVLLGTEPNECMLANRQLKVIEIALDVIAILVPLSNLTDVEIKELNVYCTAVSTELWSIACMRTNKSLSLVRSTLRLLILRVPFFRASLNSSHFFFNISSLSGSHFIIKAAQQCFSRLKVWHKEERQGQWDVEIIQESAASRTDKLHFGTVEEWSWCLECALSAFDQIWALTNKLIRVKATTSVEADRILFSQESFLDGAVNMKSDLEYILIILCDFLGEAHNMDDPKQSGCMVLYAELLPPRSKVLLSIVLDRVAQTIKSAVRYLRKRLDDGTTYAVAAVDSIACLASLLDGSYVPCSRKDLAAGMRKWYDSERKRSSFLRKRDSMMYHVECASLLGRLPKVLFRMEQFETILQSFSASFRVAHEKKLKSSSMYNAIFQKVLYKRKKLNSKRKMAKFDSCLLQSLMQYNSIARKSENFGMAFILERSSKEDSDALPNFKDMNGDSESRDFVHNFLVGPDDSRKNQWCRKRSFRKVWSKLHKSAPRSRNKAVDEWLQTDIDLGDDTFADLEDFLVPG